MEEAAAVEQFEQGAASEEFEQGAASEEFEQGAASEEFEAHGRYCCCEKDLTTTRTKTVRKPGRPPYLVVVASPDKNKCKGQNSPCVGMGTLGTVKVGMQHCKPRVSPKQKCEMKAISDRYIDDKCWRNFRTYRTRYCNKGGSLFTTKMVRKCFDSDIGSYRSKYCRSKGTRFDADCFNNNVDSFRSKYCRSKRGWEENCFRNNVGSYRRDYCENTKRGVWERNCFQADVGSYRREYCDAQASSSSATAGHVCWAESAYYRKKVCQRAADSGTLINKCWDSDVSEYRRTYLGEVCYANNFRFNQKCWDSTRVRYNDREDYTHYRVDYCHHKAMKSPDSNSICWSDNIGSYKALVCTPFGSRGKYDDECYDEDIGNYRQDYLRAVCPKYGRSGKYDENCYDTNYETYRNDYCQKAIGNPRSNSACWGDFEFYRLSACSGWGKIGQYEEKCLGVGNDDFNYWTDFCTHRMENTPSDSHACWSEQFYREGVCQHMGRGAQFSDKCFRSKEQTGIGAYRNDYCNYKIRNDPDTDSKCWVETFYKKEVCALFGKSGTEDAKCFGENIGDYRKEYCTHKFRNDPESDSMCWRESFYKEKVCALFEEKRISDENCYKEDIGNYQEDFCKDKMKTRPSTDSFCWAEDFYRASVCEHFGARGIYREPCLSVENYQEAFCTKHMDSSNAKTSSSVCWSLEFYRDGLCERFGDTAKYDADCWNKDGDKIGSKYHERYCGAHVALDTADADSPCFALDDYKEALCAKFTASGVHEARCYEPTCEGETRMSAGTSTDYCRRELRLSRTEGWIQNGFMLYDEENRRIAKGVGFNAFDSHVELKYDGKYFGGGKFKTATLTRKSCDKDESCEHKCGEYTVDSEPTKDIVTYSLCEPGMQPVVFSYPDRSGKKKERDARRESMTCRLPKRSGSSASKMLGIRSLLVGSQPERAFGSWKPLRGDWNSVHDFPLDGAIKEKAKASIKNGLLVPLAAPIDDALSDAARMLRASENARNGKAYVQHIKTGKNKYGLVVYAPFTPLQAMAYALVMQDNAHFWA